MFKDIIYNKTKFELQLKKRFEIYRDIVLINKLDLGYTYYSEKVLYSFYEGLTKNKKSNLPPINNKGNFPIDNFLFLKLEQLDIDEIITSIYSIKYIYIFGYYNKTDALEIYKLFNSTSHFDIPLIYANYNNTEITVSNFVEFILYKPLVTENLKVVCNTDEKYTSRFMNFVNYTLKTSCLADMLEDILRNDKKFKDIRIILEKQTYIYIGYIFYNEVIENNQFMKNIITRLKENEEMRSHIDVIGDRFYYLLKGYKKIKSLKHYNMVDSGRSIAFDNIYKTIGDNNINEFNLESYDEFIQEIEKLIYQGIPYIEIVSEN